MESFCGSEFWNSSKTWDTDDPDFTECFHQTVLLWVPCGLIWLLAPYETYQILYSKARYIPWSFVNIPKLVINLMLIALSISSVGYAIYQNENQGEDVADVYYVSPCILAVTFALVLGLTLAGKKRGIQSSGSLFIFWFFLTFCGVFTYISRIKSISDGMSQEEEFPFVWNMIYFPLVFGMFVLNFISDAAPKYVEGEIKSDNPSPELSASFPSRMIYHWFNALAWKGYKKPLEYPDLWNLNPRDTSRQVVPRFDYHWEKSLSKKMKVGEPKAVYGAENGVDFKPSAPKQKMVSILPAIVKTFGPKFLLGGLLKAFQDTLGFVSPQILRLLIAFVSNKDIQDWKGYLYAVILTVTAITQTVFLSQYFQRMFIVGLQVRTAITATVYRKAIRMSSSSRKDSTVGEIVNLMAVDAQRFMDLTTYLNMIWSAPLQIALAIYFLYDILGVAVFAGLAVMILLIPVNGVLANATKKLQIKQMKNKDRRVKMMNEILSGIKVLKLYAWEPSFQANVEDIRQKEIVVLKKSAYLGAGTAFIWTCAPFLVSLMSFMVFVLKGYELTADVAFVSLTLFNIIRMPMTILPLLIVQFVQANVSLQRLNKFLNSAELDPSSVSHNPSGNPIDVEKASFAWDREEAPILKNINMSVKHGQLVAVVGQVGAGKTSLISALLGEMEKINGTVSTYGRIAYVPQQAWIQNCTLRDNILFGKSFESTTYKKIVDACAMTPDLAMLPGGDSTEIGEKGINLSGGQKQRVSLARAVYADLDVYLFDDPLSAVDSHVGKQIFDQVIGPQGVLKKKTRLLVTHGITFLPQVDQIVVLKDGEVTEVGSYQELLSQKGAFAEFLLSHLDQASDEDGNDLDEIKQQLEDSMGKDEFQRQLDRQRSMSMSSSQNGDGTGSLSRHSSITSLERSGSRSGSLRRRSSTKDVPNPAPAPTQSPQNSKLIDVEKAETGKVKGTVYIHYMSAIGGWLSFFTLILYIVYQFFSMYSNIWLSQWSAANVTSNHERDVYLGVYGALGAGQAIFSLIASLGLALGTLLASDTLHQEMLARIMRCPMSYFDTTPFGRIINRFAKDVDTVDNIIPMTLRTAITCFLSVIATVIIIGIGTPIFIAVAVPIGIFYWWLQNVYVATSRQLKRLESISRSPIYSHFGETLTGASVIRAYGEQQRFILESENRVDVNQICYYPSIIANRWLSVRLETVGNLVVLFAALFAVISRESLDPGLVGLSISYALNITQTLNWFMRMTSEVETNIVSVERIIDYSKTPQEASWEVGKVTPPKEWPTNGHIVFDDYQVRYREGLDLVLKGISCEVKGGEKVGIVGRTGAGKSSLTLGLFRIIEAASGKIVIDGINIADLALHSLRSRITIIPQDPVLFSGSLRMNLDPFKTYSDDEVWNALEHAHLKTFVKSLPTNLDHEVSEGGENLSIGQRQLICLARALLRKTKVLVLDEATAAVDLETDDLIQATIRKEFKDASVVTIAHRLNTIMDSNRVLVLDHGEIKEYAPPSELLANKQSIFYGMAKDAGLV